MTGSVTLSLEIELAWGQHDKEKSPICSPDRSEEERYLNELLATCDEYGISVTFDIVGHLLLDECDGNHHGPHEVGWFSADPGTNATIDPLFYWPNVAEIIGEQSIDHDVATHTFSHVLCDEIDNQTLEWELQRCFEVHRDAGFGVPQTIVSPRHKEVSYDVLLDLDIRGVRTVKRYPEETTVGRYVQRAKYWSFDRGHPAFAPQRCGELVELFTTPYPSLTAVHLPNGRSKPLWVFRHIPVNVRRRIHQSYLSDAIETAMKTDSNVHLWTHLYNMANKVQWSCIDPFLRQLGEAQQDELVEVLTMSELANRTLS